MYDRLCMLPEGYLPILPTIKRKLSPNKNIYTPRIMVTQRQLCVKLDAYTFDQLDQECLCTGRKRNKIINDAVRMYLDAVDARLRHQPEKFVSEWFPHLRPGIY